MRFISVLVFALLLSPVAWACEPVAPMKSSTEQVQASININTADANTLQRLKGVGVVKAQAIVDYRNAHGAFASIDELMEVKGIGKTLLQKNASLLSID